MTTRKPRIIATLEPELRRGQFWLERCGITPSRIVAEGIVALAYLDDADRTAVRDWTTVLEKGGTSWDEFRKYVAKARREQSKALAELLEELLQHEIETEAEGVSKRRSKSG